MNLALSSPADAELAKIAGALDPEGRLLRLREGGQQQARKDADDRDRHQQFDERKSVGDGGGLAWGESPPELIRASSGRRAEADSYVSRPSSLISSPRARLPSEFPAATIPPAGLGRLTRRAGPMTRRPYERTARDLQHGV